MPYPKQPTGPMLRRSNSVDKGLAKELENLHSVAEDLSTSMSMDEASSANTSFDSVADMDCLNDSPAKDTDQKTA